MEDILAYTVQTGFSVAVAAYLLVRMEGRIEALNATLQSLQVVLARLDERKRL